MPAEKSTAYNCGTCRRIHSVFATAAEKSTAQIATQQRSPQRICDAAEMSSAHHSDVCGEIHSVLRRLQRNPRRKLRRLQETSTAHHSNVCRRTVPTWINVTPAEKSTAYLRRLYRSHGAELQHLQEKSRRRIELQHLQEMSRRRIELRYLRGMSRRRIATPQEMSRRRIELRHLQEMSRRIIATSAEKSSAHHSDACIIPTSAEKSRRIITTPAEKSLAYHCDTCRRIHGA
jgi:hypothetical protein